jgi:ABC-type multidrug transport system fused ATPase/permease subunit
MGVFMHKSNKIKFCLLKLEQESVFRHVEEPCNSVLHDLSFEIKSNEQVGVVGRTGSKKSSLKPALSRTIPYYE